MELLRNAIWPLLVFCSALWVTSSSDEKAQPSSCDSTLTFSLDNRNSPEVNRRVNSRSLSPWTWRSTTVKNQIPPTLWEAECSSKFCFSTNPEQLDHQDLDSVPVYQRVLVLNQRDSESCYTASYRTVAVGCTCVRARTRSGLNHGPDQN